MYAFKQFTNPYILVVTVHKETITKPTRNEHSPLMGKFRFLDWRSFGNTHGAPNSTVHTKQVVNIGIVGRRRWAIESHFLVVQWMDVFFYLFSQFPFWLMMQHFYTVWPASAEYLSVQRTCPYTSKCQSPHQSAASHTDSGFVLLLLMSINTKKKMACFMSGLNLSRVPHRYNFQRPTFSDLVL